MLTDDILCVKVVVRAKIAFFEQYSSTYYKISFVDNNVILHLFGLHAMSFHGAETWYMRLNKKNLKNISVPYQGAIKRDCVRNWYANNRECPEQVNLPVFKHSIAKKTNPI